MGCKVHAAFAGVPPDEVLVNVQLLVTASKVSDIKAIAGYDPRVSFDNIIITEYEQGLQIELQLRYVPTNQTNVMKLSFNNQTQTLSAQ